MFGFCFGFAFFFFFSFFFFFFFFFHILLLYIFQKLLIFSGLFRLIYCQFQSISNILISQHLTIGTIWFLTSDPVKSLVASSLVMNMQGDDWNFQCRWREPRHWKFQTKQWQIRKKPSPYPFLKGLNQSIYARWRERIRDLPTSLCDYRGSRDELTVQDGIIFKGRQVLIPVPLRADIFTQLHRGYVGIEKTRLLARETVYRPRLHKDVEKLCKSCELYQELQPQQATEPMVMHERQAAPWIKVGSDLFEIDGKNFLIISDYSSRHPVFQHLKFTTADDVIISTKEAFSMLGTPKEILSEQIRSILLWPGHWTHHKKPKVPLIKLVVLVLYHSPYGPLSTVYSCVPLVLELSNILTRWPLASSLTVAWACI